MGNYEARVIRTSNITEVNMPNWYPDRGNLGFVCKPASCEKFSFSRELEHSGTSTVGGYPSAVGTTGASGSPRCLPLPLICFSFRASFVMPQASSALISSFPPQGLHAFCLTSLGHWHYRSNLSGSCVVSQSLSFAYRICIAVRGVPLLVFLLWCSGTCTHAHWVCSPPIKSNQISFIASK